MNQYELVVLLSKALDDEAKSAAMEKAKGYVTRFGGTVTKEFKFDKRLAYPIDNVTEGTYNIVNFEAPATAPAEIEKRIRILEPVLRYLVVRADEAEVAVPVKVEEDAPAVVEEVEEVKDVEETTEA